MAKKNYEINIETSSNVEFLLKVTKDKKLFLIRGMFNGEGVDVEVYSVPHNIIPFSEDGCNPCESYLWEGHGVLEQSKFLKLMPNLMDNLYDNPWVGYHIKNLIEEL